MKPVIVVVYPHDTGRRWTDEEGLVLVSTQKDITPSIDIFRTPEGRYISKKSNVSGPYAFLGQSEAAMTLIARGEGAKLTKRDYDAIQHLKLS